MISKKLRTTGNMFIINLAIADFIVILIVEPFNYIGKPCTWIQELVGDFQV